MFKLKIKPSDRRKAHSFFNACLAGDLDGVKLIFSKNFHTINGDLLDKQLSSIEMDPKSWGRRPIHVATIGGHIQIVKYLVENGANINIKNKYGDTALHFCVHHNCYQIYSYLLVKGADPNILNNVNLSPIDVAKQQNKYDLFIKDKNDVG